MYIYICIYIYIYHISLYIYIYDNWDGGNYLQLCSREWRERFGAMVVSIFPMKNGEPRSFQEFPKHNDSEAHASSP